MAKKALKQTPPAPSVPPTGAAEVKERRAIFSANFARYRTRYRTVIVPGSTVRPPLISRRREMGYGVPGFRFFSF